MTLNLTQKEIDAWQQFIYDTTPGAEKQAATATAQTIIYNDNRVYNVQMVSINSNGTMPPVRNVLEAGRSETAMDVTARKLAKPMTAEDAKLLKAQDGWMAGYR
jgi:hypothetical protein